MEHLLAALDACGIDNARIEYEMGNEIPVLDGSAHPWCDTPPLRYSIGLLPDIGLCRANYHVLPTCRPCFEGRQALSGLSWWSCQALALRCHTASRWQGQQQGSSNGVLPDKQKPAVMLSLAHDATAAVHRCIHIQNVGGRPAPPKGYIAPTRAPIPGLDTPSESTVAAFVEGKKAPEGKQLSPEQAKAFAGAPPGIKAVPIEGAKEGEPQVNLEIDLTAPKDEVDQMLMDSMVPRPVEYTVTVRQIEHLLTQVLFSWE